MLELNGRYEDLTDQQREDIEVEVVRLLKVYTPIGALRRVILHALSQDELLKEVRHHVIKLRDSLKMVEEADKEVSELLSDGKDHTEE